MNRRRILLSYLTNSFSWELYSKTYFYNELVPTTINSKNVLNKAKIVKVSGNGAIENQLVEKIQAYGLANCTVTGSNTNEITLVADGNGNITFTCNLYLTANTSKKYLISYFIETSISGLQFESYFINSPKNILPNQINQFSIIPTTGINNLNIHNIRINGSLQNGDVIKVRYNVVDLTLREGTGNEPTTLTDNRIQNILNRGYIAYNLGKYKESDIGVVSSEPYNLFDDEWEVGGFNNDGSFNSNQFNARSKNLIPIIPTKQYSVENTSFFSSTYTSSNIVVVEYDKNGNFLRITSGLYASNTGTYTIRYENSIYSYTPNNDVYYIRIRLYIGDYNFTNNLPNGAFCFHITGTRTGYAPHKTFTPITFKAQLGGAINSHNTMEITKANVVFTKNVSSVDLGTLNYTYQTQQQRFYSNGIQGKNPNNDANYIPNMLSSNFVANSINGIGENQVTYYNNLFFIKGSGLGTTNQDAKSYLSGKYLHYELATPQVISIPKKHLGIVDLGSLNWEYVGGSYTAYAQLTGAKQISSSIIANIYCSKYMTYKEDDITSKTSGISLANVLIVQDSSLGTNATQIKQALAGQYLFYETENEVADIENVVDIESGGTITTDSEVLPNIELSVKCK